MKRTSVYRTAAPAELSVDHDGQPLRKASRLGTVVTAQTDPTESADEQTSLVALDIDALGVTTADEMLIVDSGLLMNNAVLEAANHGASSVGTGAPTTAGSGQESCPSQDDQGDFCPSDEVAEVGMSIIDDEWVEEGDGSWPDVWTQEMWMDRRAKHHWLSAKKGKLGCRYCFRVKYMGCSAGEAIGFSTDWLSYGITCSGESREQRLKSLRNKIQRHEVSKTHIKAEELIKNFKDNPPTRTTVTKMLNKNIHMTAQIFKDVYAIIKEDVAFDSYRGILNDVMQTKSYKEFAVHHDFDPVRVAEHFAEDLRSQITKEIIAHKFPLAVVVDHIEGYLGSAQTVFLIYIRAKMDDGLKNIFWDAVPYPSVEDADCNPLHAVTQSLLGGGFTVEYLSEQLICFVTDPLGVHLGAESTLCNQLAISFDKIVIWYVLAYRLELMVFAAFRNLNLQSCLGQLYDVLHTLTQLSERNVQELLINTPGVYEQMLRIGSVFSAAEVAASFRAVEALTEAYPILYEYMVQAGNDQTRTAEEKDKYAMAKVLMESEQFVRELAMSYDVLKLLAGVRSQIDSDCDIARADCILVKAMEDLVQLQASPGPFETAALAEIQSRVFFSVPLTSNADLEVANRQAFMEQIVALSKQNMISVSGLAEDLVENFIRDLYTVKLGSWPSAPPVSYADESVRRLCAVFEIENEAEIRRAFRTYVASDRKEISENMALIQTYADVFPCSSSLIASVVDKVNKLPAVNDVADVAKLGAVLFLHVNGRPVEQFEPLPLVRSWCSKHPLLADLRTAKKARKSDLTPLANQKWNALVERNEDDSTQELQDGEEEEEEEDVEETFLEE